MPADASHWIAGAEDVGMKVPVDSLDIHVCVSPELDLAILFPHHALWYIWTTLCGQY